MSEPRIALVAEGATDAIVIEAALRAVLGRPFLLSLLQPEPTRPDLGGGWAGVFKWCQEFRQRKAPSLESDPTLQGFHMVIVHLDADVAHGTYANCGPSVASAAQGLGVLPCDQPCPPPSATVTALERVLLTWLGLSGSGPQSLFCLPSKAIESWLAAAILSSGHPALTGLECNLNLGVTLAQLPKAQRVRKSQLDYRAHASEVTLQWQQIQSHCSQALAFQRQVSAKTGSFPPP